MDKTLTARAGWLVLILATLPAAAREEQKAANSAMPKPATKQLAPPAAGKWHLTLQTGFAETFQLTLGGVFGDGPAWQNRAALVASNVLLTGDAVSFSGWATRDTPSRRDDWIAAASYRARVLHRGGQSLHLGGSLERWQFPSVLTGARDWIGGFNGVYTTRLGRAGFQLQSTVYNTLTSTLKQGTLIHSQSWFEHRLLSRERVSLSFRHGPQHTYSWNFYGTTGHRVLRYAGALLLTAKDHQFEIGYRPQYGLQQRIRGNRFWYVQMSHTF